MNAFNDPNYTFKPIYITADDVKNSMAVLKRVVKGMADEARERERKYVVVFEFEDGIIEPRLVIGTAYKNVEIGTVIEVTFKEIMGMTADYEVVNKEEFTGRTTLKLKRKSLFESK